MRSFPGYYHKNFRSCVRCMRDACSTCFLKHLWRTVYRFKQVVSNISRSSALRLGLFHKYGRFFQVTSNTYSFSQQQPYQSIELHWICRIFHFSFHVQCLYRQQELPLKAWPNIYIIRIILTTAFADYFLLRHLEFPRKF